MKLFLGKLLSIFVIVLFFDGCCKQETIYVDRVTEVNVPVVCKIPEVKKPSKGENMSETLLNIKEYILKLEESIKVCQ